MKITPHILFLFFIITIISCKKEKSELDKSGNLHISFKLDGQLISVTADDLPGNGSGYTICAVNGCHFGYGAAYGVQGIGSIGFLLGQINSNQPKATFPEFKNLFSTGAKIYDSLRVLQQLNINRVEVEYHDLNGHYYSTTNEVYNTSGEIQRIVNQPGSSFIIDEMKEVTVNGQPGGVKFKGRFNCILYEKGGNGQKLVTDAEFIATVFKLN